jgi:hypothetical protein
MYSYAMLQRHMLHASIIRINMYVKGFIARLRLLFGGSVITAVPNSHGHSPLNTDHGLESRSGHQHLSLSSVQSGDRDVSMI